MPALVCAQQPGPTNVATTDKDAKSAPKAEKSADPTTPNSQDNVKVLDQLRTTFEFGGQYINLDGERPSKFEEYKRVRDGFLFRRFSVPQILKVQLFL
jgi:hypothetical protein